LETYLVVQCEIMCTILQYLLITPAKEDMQSSLFVCLSVSNFAQKTSERICMKFSMKRWQWAMKKWLNFGGDPYYGSGSGPWRRYALFQCFWFIVIDSKEGNNSDDRNHC